MPKHYKLHLYGNSCVVVFLSSPHVLLSHWTLGFVLEPPGFKGPLFLALSLTLSLSISGPIRNTARSEGKHKQTLPLWFIQPLKGTQLSLYGGAIASLCDRLHLTVLHISHNPHIAFTQLWSPRPYPQQSHSITLSTLFFIKTRTKETWSLTRSWRGKGCFFIYSSIAPTHPIQLVKGLMTSWSHFNVIHRLLCWRCREIDTER